MNPRHAIVTVLFTWLVFVLPAPGAEPAVQKTALDDYIAKPDPTYSWKVVKKVRGEGYTTFIVDLKSQSWRKPPEVDRSVWQHWLIVVKPDDVKYDTAFLQITGGANDGKAPEKADAAMIRKPACRVW